MKTKLIIFISIFIAIIGLLCCVVLFMTHEHPKEIKTSKNIENTDSTEYKIIQNLDSTKSEDIYLGHIISLKDLKTKTLYTKNCKFCHGESGKGDGIKSRTDSTICPYDLTKENKSDKFIYYVILNGKNYMPSHAKKLDDENINILVIYIKKQLK